jgi:hypothetical protein
MPDNRDHEWEPFSSTVRSDTTTQFVSSEPETSGSRRSTTTVPPKPIGWPAESVVLLVATSAVFEVSNSLRDVIDVPKAGPQLTEHLSAQLRPDSDSFWGGSRPLLGKSESAKPYEEALTSRALASASVMDTAIAAVAARASAIVDRATLRRVAPTSTRQRSSGFWVTLIQIYHKFDWMQV